jgi:hypothetical protein
LSKNVRIVEKKPFSKFFLFVTQPNWRDSCFGGDEGGIFSSLPDRSLKSHRKHG